jgi:hypothetical protein
MQEKGSVNMVNLSDQRKGLSHEFVQIQKPEFIAHLYEDENKSVEEENAQYKWGEFLGDVPSLVSGEGDGLLTNMGLLDMDCAYKSETDKMELEAEVLAT